LILGTTSSSRWRNCVRSLASPSKAPRKSWACSKRRRQVIPVQERLSARPGSSRTAPGEPSCREPPPWTHTAPPRRRRVKRRSMRHTPPVTPRRPRTCIRLRRPTRSATSCARRRMQRARQSSSLAATRLRARTRRESSRTRDARAGRRTSSVPTCSDRQEPSRSPDEPAGRHPPEAVISRDVVNGPGTRSRRKDPGRRALSWRQSVRSDR